MAQTCMTHNPGSQGETFVSERKPHLQSCFYGVDWVHNCCFRHSCSCTCQGMRQEGLRGMTGMVPIVKRIDWHWHTVMISFSIIHSFGSYIQQPVCVAGRIWAT